MKTNGPCTRPTRNACRAAAAAARPKRMAVAFAAERGRVATRSCESAVTSAEPTSPSTIEVWREERRDYSPGRGVLAGRSAGASSRCADQTPRVSLDFDLVVPTLGRSADLARFLGALEAQSYRSFRLTVVVDQDGKADLEP